MSRLLNTAAMFVVAFTLTAQAGAAEQSGQDGNWVTSWYASPHPVWGSEFILPTNVPAHLQNQSVREALRLSAGGKRLRLVFSNRYGNEPLVIGGVRLTRSDAGATDRTEHQVTFSGQRAAVVAPGARTISDPVDVTVPPLARLSVTSHFPRRTPVTTFHWGSQQTAHLAAGDQTAAADFKPDGIVKGRLFLSSVLVDAPLATRTVVTIGDSITDGNGSTPDTDSRWPDFLASRLARRGVAVANAGISGARLLKDRMGVNAMARFEQDVLSQPGVAAVIVLLGINDIGWPGSPFAPSDQPVSLQEIASGYQQLIASARSNRVRIIGATLPPFEAALEGTPFAGHYSREKEQVRQAVNHWIRTAGAFDAVVDFDAVLRDTQHPGRMLAKYDSGDHLHPGDAGYRAMAEAIDLGVLFGGLVTRDGD